MAIRWFECARAGRNEGVVCVGGMDAGDSNRWLDGTVVTIMAILLLESKLSRTQPHVCHGLII